MTIPELRGVGERDWVTFVLSSKSLPKLREDAKQWSKRTDPKQLAIYAAPNGNYALAILGDGTFTSAYNQTIALRRDHPDVYFVEQKDWGANLLFNNERFRAMLVSLHNEH